MLPNAFIGKTRKPTDDELSAALGPVRVLWDQLVADLAAEFAVNIQEWNSYSPKAGWFLRLKHKKRNIIYLGPAKGCVNVAFILGDKAVAAARQSRLTGRMVKILDEAPKYPEGTGVRFVMKTAADMKIAKKLAAIKLAH